MDLTELKRLLKDKVNKHTYKKLSKTDWKIIRHKEQIDAGITTSLTAEEYSQLLSDRQVIRDNSNVATVNISNATTNEEVMTIYDNYIQGV